MIARPRLRRLAPPALRRVELGVGIALLDTNAKAPKPTLAFYGSAPWKALLKRVIAKRGRRCEDPACRTPNRGQGQRIYGDHIVELADRGAPLDEANVMLKCATCHGRKTAQAREARGGGRETRKGPSSTAMVLQVRAARPDNFKLRR